MAVSGVRSLLSHALSIVYVLLVSHGTHAAGQTRTIYTKLCKDSHIQIMSRRGVKIEPYERSRVELKLAGYTRPQHRRKFTLDFDFKTNSSNGTLFYAFPGDYPRDLIALTLRNGRPKYKVRCRTGHVDVSAPTRGNRPVNDNKWHAVKFDTRYNHHGAVTIDGVALRKPYVIGCENISTLIMGGHNPDLSNHHYDPEFPPLYGHFEGCIRKVNLVHNLDVPPRYYAVSECD